VVGRGADAGGTDTGAVAAGFAGVIGDVGTLLFIKVAGVDCGMELTIVPRYWLLGVNADASVGNIFFKIRSRHYMETNKADSQ
jgi:hypothetical protein